MRFARLLHALRLLGRGHLRFGGLHAGAGAARGFLGGREPLARALEVRGALDARRAGVLDLGVPAVALDVRFRDAALDFGDLGADAFQLRAHAAAVLAEERDLLLERLHVGVGGVEVALQRGEMVGLLVMAAAKILQRAFALAKLRHLRFQAHLHLLHFVGVAGLRRVRLAQPRKGEQVVVERELRLQIRVSRGDLGLLREVLELRAELGLDVPHPRQVLARVFQAQLGLAPALAIFRYARGLLEEHAQLLGLGGDDARDHALLDDRVRARAQARAEEDVLAVDVVVRIAVAREHPLHADLRVLRPRAAHAPERIVEHQLHGGAAHGLPVRGAVEDHVVHVLAAQLLRRRFAEHPAYGVYHVGLAAAVQAHHAHELPRDGDGCRIDEGFEAGKLYGSESQVGAALYATRPAGESPPRGAR